MFHDFPGDDLLTHDCKLFPESLITYPPQKLTYPYISPEN